MVRVPGPAACPGGWPARWPWARRSSRPGRTGFWARPTTAASTARTRCASRGNALSVRPPGRGKLPRGTAGRGLPACLPCWAGTRPRRPGRGGRRRRRSGCSAGPACQAHARRRPRPCPRGRTARCPRRCPRPRPGWSAPPRSPRPRSSRPGHWWCAGPRSWPVRWRSIRSRPGRDGRQAARRRAGPPGGSGLPGWGRPGTISPGVRDGTGGRGGAGGRPGVGGDAGSSHTLRIPGLTACVESAP